MGCGAKYLTEIKMQTSLHPLGFVNPVQNKTKAIRPVFQCWSALPQLLTDPDPSPPRCLCPSRSLVFVLVYLWVSRQAPRTVSSPDVAKSKIPFRDLFYLKSTPLMGLMAFQSLSVHCQ